MDEPIRTEPRSLADEALLRGRDDLLVDFDRTHIDRIARGNGRIGDQEM